VKLVTTLCTVSLSSLAKSTGAGTLLMVSDIDRHPMTHARAEATSATTGMRKLGMLVFIVFS
jgi:hypothetical protein